MPAAQFRPAMLSVYIFDSDYRTQAQHRTRNLRELVVHLMQHPTEMLHQVNLYVQKFEALQHGRYDIRYVRHTKG